MASNRFSGLLPEGITHGEKLKNLFREFIQVSVILCLLTLLVWLIDGDRELARLVVGTDGKWPGVNRFPWNMLYDYAALPGFAMAGCGLLLFLASFVFASLKRQRLAGLFLVLLLALGPGLMVNVVFKDNLGRARPRELTEFGGRYNYTEIWQPGATGHNSSFPSGHASAAFYLFAPWFIFRHQRKNTASFFLVLGIGYGLLIGATRILQGGHFLSDVLWAGGMVYLVGIFLAIIMKFTEKPLKSV
jgi:lipid A 4'-phosphatase